MAVLLFPVEVAPAKKPKNEFATAESILPAIWLFTLKLRATLSVVPIKLVVALVPALPVKFHAFAAEDKLDKGTAQSLPASFITKESLVPLTPKEVINSLDGLASVSSILKVVLAPPVMPIVTVPGEMVLLKF